MTSFVDQSLIQKQSQIDRNTKLKEGKPDIADDLSTEMELKMKIQINQSDFDKENENENSKENLAKKPYLNVNNDDKFKPINTNVVFNPNVGEQITGELQSQNLLSPSKNPSRTDNDSSCTSPSKPSHNQSPQLYYSNLSAAQQKSMTLTPCGSSSSLNQLSQPSTPNSNSNFYNYSGSNSGQISPPPIDPTNLIVNYIPLNINEEQLRMLFATYGPIARCKLVTDKYTGCSLGYGFIKYAEPEAASTAISALNGYTIANKRLKVSVSKPPEREKKTNLYISGLPIDWTQAELEELVSQFGVITEVRVLYDALTRKGKGVGFARFESMTSAAMCIERLNGITVDGGIMPLIVKYADTPADKMKKASMLTQPHHQHSLSAPFSLSVQPPASVVHSAPSSPMHYDRSQPVSPFYEQTVSPRGFPVANSLPSSSAPVQLAPPLSPAVGVPVSGPVEFIGYCLFVYHLPLEATEQTLYQLFSNYATVTSAKIMRDLATGRSKGFGFVNVLTEAQAHTAISQLNGFQIGNKYLKVAFKK